MQLGLRRSSQSKVYSHIVITQVGFIDMHLVQERRAHTPSLRAQQTCSRESVLVQTPGGEEVGATGNDQHVSERPVSDSDTPQRSHGTVLTSQFNPFGRGVFSRKNVLYQKTSSTCRLSKCVSELLKGSVSQGVSSPRRFGTLLCTLQHSNSKRTHTFWRCLCHRLPGS